MKFWWWRVRVSFIGSRTFGRIAAWGFCCNDMDRIAFDDGMTPDEYFIEAWLSDE